MKGLIIRYLLFVEKRSQTEQLYVSIRYTTWEKPAKVTRLVFCLYKCEEYLTASCDPNEIASIHIKNIFNNLKNVVEFRV